MLKNVTCQKLLVTHMEITVHVSALREAPPLPLTEAEASSSTWGRCWVLTVAGKGNLTLPQLVFSPLNY